VSALKTPADDAPAEEWGRFAASIPDWQWMPGMRVLHIEGGKAGSVRGTYLSIGAQPGDMAAATSHLLRVKSEHVNAKIGGDLC